MPTISRRTFLQTTATGALSLGWAGQQKALAANDIEAVPLTIAVLNDCHIKDLSSVSLLDNVVQRINENPHIRLTVAAGDLATDGKEEELALARQSLDKLTTPWFAVPGNHDVRLRTEDIYANYRQAFGDVHWMHQAGNGSFIGFNSCEGVKSDVVVAQSELDWLKSRIAMLDPKRPIALFCHHPLNPHSKAYRIKNAEGILALFDGYNLKLAAAGHWHGNQEEERGNILFTTSACCAVTRGNHDNTTAKGYRVFTLSDDKITTEFVVVEE